MTGDARSDLVLRPLSSADEAQARLAHEELARDGFDFLLDWREEESWDEYLERLERYRRGVDLPEGYVPATFLVADVGGQVVGRVSVRHELNAWLAVVGGHIGYSVRPAFRRRGYATEILRQALGIAHEVGVERALVTCDDGNVGSANVIERCGGRLESVAPGREGSPAKRHYWVDLL
ncbi:MAG TPA: GNAT family N-acetyltransferase [Nocardioidaceae bacterium]|nr:GNAT family N-acetyltransferase [Nocardioidaceae bacterium]